MKSISWSPLVVGAYPPWRRLRFSGELADYTGKSLPPSLFYDYPTIYELAQYLLAQRGDPSSGDEGSGWSARATPVAVIGISCRFPGADGPQAFWQLLKKGESGI